MDIADRNFCVNRGAVYLKIDGDSVRALTLLTGAVSSQEQVLASAHPTRSTGIYMFMIPFGYYGNLELNTVDKL